METWTETRGLDVTSFFRGITSPIDEMITDIQGRGWTAPKIEFKGGAYVAKAKNQHGETIEKTGPTDKTAVGNLLTAIMRKEYMRSAAQRKVGMWSKTWLDQLEPIAKAYAKAPVYDPKAAIAWQELGRDSESRYKALAKHLTIKHVDDPEPYESADAMRDDIHNKKNLLVSRANLEHPVWSGAQNSAFRAVHDVLGSGVSGGGFDWHGANQAVAAHIPLLSTEAQRALFTEVIGQAAYNQHFGKPGPQKIAFLDEHLDHAQEQENDANHHPLHPSQTIIPAKIPTIKVARGELQDPNKDWSSQIDPLPDNAYLWQKDPLDSEGAKENAHTLSTSWRDLDRPSQTAAVMNAFRAALTAPRRPLEANARHLQALTSVPSNVTDPKRYHDALEAQRKAHNDARGITVQKAHEPMLMDYYGTVKAHNPELDDGKVRELADRELLHMRTEEEERITADDKGSKLGTNEVEAKVDAALAKRLKLITKPRIDQKVDFGSENLFHEASKDDHYHPWMASHLKTISQLARHTDRLTDIAMAEPGPGHDFRANTMALGVPGVGAKEASFAWQLLNPHNSQLATITPHHLEMLGHKPDDTNKRDYGKYERELAAGRDAAGYGHVPLGTFSWAMYDHKRSPGKHQSYAGLKVINPSPPDTVEHHPSFDSWAEPSWWAATKPARDKVGQEWDRTVAIDHPAESAPFVTKTAASQLVPAFMHEGIIHTGEPGQSHMQHIRGKLNLSTEDVWAQNHAAWKQ